MSATRIRYEVIADEVFVNVIVADCSAGFFWSAADDEDGENFELSNASPYQSESDAIVDAEHQLRDLFQSNLRKVSN